MYDEERYNCSKGVLGCILSIFLGLIGLLIGVCLYPAGTRARTTFIKGWIIFPILIICAIVIIVLVVNFHHIRYAIEKLFDFR